MTGGSKFAVLYSMPYSSTMYCVSPSSEGNSASIMAAPAADETCGERCLSVLNSWDDGSNRITQTVTLPEGEYKLTFLAQYVCANEVAHLADDIITTTSDNVNYSLCGISFNGTEMYRYPKVANNWELVELPFTLDEETAVTVSMGLKTTSKDVGAANNTRLYLDHVRLYSKNEKEGDGIVETKNISDDEMTDVYNLQGIKLREKVAVSQATKGLPEGIYIVNHKKIYHH